MTIRCSQGHDNPDGSAYCDECGEQLGAGFSTAPADTSAATMPSVSPTGAAKLVVQSDNATFDLAGKTEVVIGREDPVSNIYPDIDLTPHGGEEGGVSRLHAKMLVSDGQYLIEDQNSTNFTFVNKQKLAPKTPTAIKDGDEIRLGRVVMTFHTM